MCEEIHNSIYLPIYKIPEYFRDFVTHVGRTALEEYTLKSRFDRITFIRELNSVLPAATDTETYQAPEKLTLRFKNLKHPAAVNIDQENVLKFVAKFNTMVSLQSYDEAKCSLKMTLYNMPDEYPLSEGVLVVTFCSTNKDYIEILENIYCKQ